MFFRIYAFQGLSFLQSRVRVQVLEVAHQESTEIQNAFCLEVKILLI